MTRRTYSLLAMVAALAAALALSACDVPAAGKPMLYADQVAVMEDVAEPTGEPEEDDGALAPETPQGEASDVDFFPVERVGEGAVSLRMENHLGSTISSISIRKNGTDEWPEETTYTRLSIPNGSQFELSLDVTPMEYVDVRYEGTDGTTFLTIKTGLGAIAMDHIYNSILMLRYDKGVAYVEYTNLYGFTVDTHLSAEDGLAHLRQQLEDRYETFTFTERDMEGVEAGQETENCLD